MSKKQTSKVTDNLATCVNSFLAEARDCRAFLTHNHLQALLYLLYGRHFLAKKSVEKPFNGFLFEAYPSGPAIPCIVEIYKHLENAPIWDMIPWEGKYEVAGGEGRKIFKNLFVNYQGMSMAERYLVTNKKGKAWDQTFLAWKEKCKKQKKKLSYLHIPDEAVRKDFGLDEG